ncbi:hypothetical protein MLD38_033581 [Melastoma candidum]|uniref:Uncharacterized protein n=1 Tax=Melastoma candidum TaxID=119954 RepID=A0ACB9M776_9MYRT|nr:hypothetical protein MLD38_033581 [Melastoma candidum]
MDEGEVPIAVAKTRARQSPSIPFLWEERPGISKKDWHPGTSSFRLPAPPPAKLVASVPFMWEEEPGKPLSSFSVSTLPVTSPPPKHREGEEATQEEKLCKLNGDCFGYETEESFSSSINPIKSTSPHDHPSPHSGSPSSSDAVISRTSLEGPSFLEYLFPLYAPDSGFLGEARASNIKDDVSEIMGGHRVRHSKTLQDLIMLSRRRSIALKTAVTGIENPSLDCARRNAIWCCIYGIRGKMTS